MLDLYLVVWLTRKRPTQIWRKVVKILFFFPPPSLEFRFDQMDVFFFFLNKKENGRDVAVFLSRLKINTKQKERVFHSNNNNNNNFKPKR